MKLSWFLTFSLAYASICSAQNPAVLHPWCLEELEKPCWNSDSPQKESLLLKECNARYSGIPVESRDGYIEGHSEESGITSAYKITGKTNDGADVVVTKDYGGGSGSCSEALVIHRTLQDDGDVVVTAGTIRIGIDRCLGTITDAQVTKAGDYIFEETMTPSGLIDAVAPEQESVQGSDCYHCCIGTRKILQRPSGEEKIIAVKLEKLSPIESDSCINKAIKASGSKLPSILPASKFSKLQRALKSCAKAN